MPGIKSMEDVTEHTARTSNFESNHTASDIEDRKGNKYTVNFYQFDNSPQEGVENSGIANLMPDIVRVAAAAFPHWTDNGKSFAENTLPKAKALSVIRTEDGEVVGFNIYTPGVVEGMRFLYANYAGIDPVEDADGNPKYRRTGLMERAREADIKAFNPDILTGCSAVGEVHLAIKSLSDRTDRVMYPLEGTVPSSVGMLGKKIYSIVNGADTYDSVDENTLVRHGKSPYAKGKAPYPLFNQLDLQPNDALIYLSLSKTANQKVLENVTS
jgi:hypothetical protein